MEQKRVLTVNSYEYNLLLNAMVEYRNQLKREEKSTQVIDEVLLRLIDAPVKKKSFFKKETVVER